MKRRIRLIFLLLVLLGGAVLCAIRWNAWFGNEAEPSYLVPDAPSCITLLLGQDALTERVVTWRAGQEVQPSALYLTDNKGNTRSVPATGEVVSSRAGYAAYYTAVLDSLEPGQYMYSVASGRHLSDLYSFDITSSSDPISILLFGDIQEKDTMSEFASFTSSLCERPTLMAYLGDMIERPTDDYWQVWYTSTHGTTACIPQLAVPGNHEYLKGIRKVLDSRWDKHFIYPKNGPSHHLGHSYYIDYPMLRLICIDTDGLQLLSDYTTTQTWLKRALLEKGDRWTIVLMHHPVYSAGMGRFNPSVFNAFRSTLRDADVVLAGHDHCYARRAATTSEGFATPVYIVTTSSSKKYISSCDERDQRIASNYAFYEAINVTTDTLSLETRLLATGEIYDAFSISSSDRKVVVSDSLPAEILELPDRYKDESSLRVSRFKNAALSR